MSKLYSGGLLLTLVFSTAHTPTFQLWHDEPRPDHEPTAVTQSDIPSFGHRFLTSDLAAALPRELAEEDNLKRFELDEFNLPNLDVSLPTLFEWSDLEHEYLADNHVAYDAFAYALDSAPHSAFPSRSRFGALGGGASFGSGMSASIAAGRDSDGQTAIQDMSGEETNSSKAGSDSGAEESRPAAPGSNEPESTGLPTNDDDSRDDDSAGDVSAPDQQAPNTAPEQNTVGDPPVDDNPTDSRTAPEQEPSDQPPVEESTPDIFFPVTPTNPPVQVPAPGTFGLFALGLAGLRLAGRKKKQKRLAAS